MSWDAAGYVKKLKVAPNGQRLKSGQKTVLLVMADAHNEETGLVEISLKRLAEDSLMSVRGVLNVVQRLIDCGQLTVQHRLDPKYGHRTNAYHIAGCPQRPTTTRRRGTEQTSVGPTEQTSVGGTEQTSVGPTEQIAHRLKTFLIPSLSLLSEKERVAPGTGARGAPAGACGPEEDLAEAFWKAAEGRNGKRPMYKAKALEYFRKYVPEDLQRTCIEGYKRYLRECRDTDRLPCDPFRFIKSQKGELWREWLPKPDADLAPARRPAVEIRGEAPPMPISEMVEHLRKGRQTGAPA